MLQRMDLNIALGDALKWSDLNCDAPHIMGEEATRSRAYIFHGCSIIFRLN